MKNTLRGCKRPPNDEETHIKQPEDSVRDGGRLYYEMRPRRNVWGDDFTSFGAANEATKKSDNKTDHGLRGRLRTNNTQQSTENTRLQWRRVRKGCKT